MSDIRFNQWLHNSGTGGVSQVDGGHVGIGTTNPEIAVHSGNNKILNVGIVTASSYYGDGSNLSGIVGGGTSLSFNDNIGAYFGNSQDLKIHHDGNHSYIDDQGTGNLRLRSGTLEVLNLAGNKTSAIFSSGGGQTLNFNNGARFVTTNEGVTFSTGSSSCVVRLTSNNSSEHILQAFNNDLNIKAPSSGGISLVVNGSSEKLKLDSSGNLLLNTTTATRHLSIKDPGQIYLESTDTGSWLGIQLKGSSGTNNYNAYFGLLDSNGDFFIDNGSNGNDFVITQSGMITCSGRVNIGTSGVLKAEINNAVSGHQFISQCSDNNNGFEIYQQHGSTATRNTLAVYDNRRGSKIESLLIRGDGVKVTRSRGGNYARTYEFNYNTGAPGGVQTVSLATVINYGGTTSAVADVAYVGVYGTANNYIYSGKWICGVRRANNDSAWNQTAAETAANGNQSEASLDVYWSSGQLYAQTVGPWMGWTVNVRVTILNGEITVNV